MQRTGTQDLISGLKFWEVYSYLGYDDIKQRYKRTLLGPMWLVLSNLMLVVFMSVVMSSIFSQNIKEILPFVATGIIIWSFISTVISEGCSIFLSAEIIIKFVNMPLSINIYRFLVRNVIVMAHNFAVIFIVVMALTPHSINFNIVYLIPNLAMIIVLSLNIGIILSLLNTRYRDIQPIIAVLLTLLPLATPIFWKKEFLTTNLWIVNFNPLYHVIEIVRAPLLGLQPNTASMLIVFLVTVALSTISVYLYNKYYNKVIFWL